MFKEADMLTVLSYSSCARHVITLSRTGSLTMDHFETLPAQQHFSSTLPDPTALFQPWASPSTAEPSLQSLVQLLRVWGSQLTYLFLFFCSSRDWTQSLTHAKQMPCHRSTFPTVCGGVAMLNTAQCYDGILIVRPWRTEIANPDTQPGQ